MLLGGVPGVPRGKVAILGGGVVGTNAAKVAVGFGAAVTVLDVNPNRLAYLDDIFRASSRPSTPPRRTSRTSSRRATSSSGPC